MRKIFLALLLAFCFVGTSFGETAIPVIEIPYYKTSVVKPGWEERDSKFKRWLTATVQVTRYNGGGGSGTICYYDPIENWAYVVSAGHLFARNGYKSAEEYKKNPDVRKITTWYHNDKKLDEPKEYEAEVLCYIYQGVYDVSLMRFKPDWLPWVCPIAAVDYKLEKNKYYHSCGSDGLREVAHYLVKFEYESKNQRSGVTEIITTENNPRGGRSGGGVMSDDYQIVFICSRGNNYGYWTSLNQIHRFLKAEGFGFVLPGQLAIQIPILDHQNPGKSHPRLYVPFPSRNLAL